MTASGACTSEIAHDLRARGFALCKPDRGTKCPTAKGWSVRSLEARDFSKDDLIGIMGGPLSDGNQTGHALVILDLDAADAVRLADDHLPASGMCEGRPSKPRSHRYYLVPLASVPKWAHSTADQAAKAAKAATGHPGPFTKSFRHGETNAEVLKLIATGGQAVATGQHPSGECREWEGGSPGEPAVVPFVELWEAVCELANACGAMIPEVAPRPVGPRPRTADLRERASKYLAKLQPAVSGQNGHAVTYWAARCMVYGFDLPADDALALLLNEYNPRCEPPWSEKELRHKVENADRCPYAKHPRGWLRDAARREQPSDTSRANGQPTTASTATNSPPDGANASPDGRLTGTQTILAYFRRRYRPAFRRGNAIVCADGETVPMNVATAVPDSKLIEQLAATGDAPTYKGGSPNRNALPGFFKSWAKVAWGDLLAALPDEDAAELGDTCPAGDEFRRLVREALLTEVVLGDRVEGTTITQVERRPLIDWCYRFATLGPWRDIRGKRCWCKLAPRDGGEVVLRVAIRHELFAQLRADRRLCEMGMNTFTRRAERYGVGSTSRTERPHGRSAVVLADDLVADLLAGLSDRDDAENVSAA